MARFKIVHRQAVWERCTYIVEADNEEDAADMLDIVDAWQPEVEEAVEGIDSDIVSIEPFNEEGKELGEL